ncbi:MAG: hypothetical protein COZ06_05150 [Armatimonadetes bacterium CG_4_10_14_3_um_filter_66_18]|nr:hypothetical protein [Armatimonadota bacterium]PIU90875.1 MAG: hypothetical protein COS65_23690 [Armatimonadetes bacterium CG06_land_8_20_14_3_00_66_21]PIX38066.1 MAG: hypothetical protein COZ57_31345 [Armatimonadetes bacterium CG_4_8_14_3_um_filter_66_20]PIY51239.1 MAG: hypothetical protein COZ06_05150 [Armatimonadetes bacterium CG_4_10_14_3_um_filter_66_18]PIZ49846.1 MAG: hypothetical protein COY42_02865 [Armatimonadetes bacterium CG_4_10_14_0_8_um_filter_66_14]PJB75943.1 MAG: hypothetica
MASKQSSHGPVGIVHVDLKDQTVGAGYDYLLPAPVVELDVYTENERLRRENGALKEANDMLREQLQSRGLPTAECLRGLVDSVSAVDQVEAILQSADGEVEIVLADMDFDAEEAIWAEVQDVNLPGHLLARVHTRLRRGQALEEMIGSRTMLFVR